MTSNLNIKYPKAPGLTLEQAIEAGEELKKFREELDSDGTAVYPNWPDKTKKPFPNS